MNASFQIGEILLMSDDGMRATQAELKGMALAVEIVDDLKIKRVFTALGEGGHVQMPVMKTFWSSSFGMPTDKFGVSWMANVEVPKA